MANIYSMSDTWNDAGTTFTGIGLNVTDTASASGSLLMDLQVGGVSQLRVSKTGAIIFSGNSGRITQSPSNSAISFGGVNNTTTFGISFPAAGIGNSPVTLNSSSSFGFSSTSNCFSAQDVSLYRDAAGTLAQRNSTNAQTFNLYNTYTDASNYERGFMRWNSNVLEIGTVSAGTGGSRSVGIYSNNVRYQIIGSNLNQFDKNLYMNGANIVTGGAGFKIGTAANQPIGFWNATPVVQPTTGISAGSFVANTSGIINDTATFDGYTIGQVVAALRQIGLLA